MPTSAEELDQPDRRASGRARGGGPTPASAGAPDLLLDASAAIPLVTSDHEHHVATLRAVSGQRLGLAGLAAFETFSVLTRLPSPARRTPAAVARLLAANFHNRFLGTADTARLLEELTTLGLAGGSCTTHS